MPSFLQALAAAGVVGALTSQGLGTFAGAAALIGGGQALNGAPCTCFDLDLRSRVHGRPVQLQVRVEGEGRRVRVGGCESEGAVTDGSRRVRR